MCYNNRKFDFYFKFLGETALDKDKFINCVKCTNYYVTWDKTFPNGCKLFGFKSGKMPSSTVLEATGSNCTNFIKKVTR